MKYFNKIKAKKVVKKIMSKEEYSKMKELVNAAINDQDKCQLHFGIPEDSVDVTEKIYYVIGKSGEIYEHNPDTIDEIFDEYGMA